MIELVTACNRCFVRQVPRALPRPDGNRYREPYYSSICHETQGCRGEIVFTSEEALIQHGYHQQGIPELNAPHCGFDPEAGVACDCGFQPLLQTALARQAQRAADAAKEE